MSLLDTLRFTLATVAGQRLRAGLTLLAMAIGVAAVVVLTALGEGARRFVIDEFAALGTHLLIVLPGRSETVGAAPPLLAETPRDLTLDDAMALLQSPHVSRIAPISLGAAEVSFGARSREVTIVGTTAEFLEIRHLHVGLGQFLPPGRSRVASSVAVIGPKVREEMFGMASPLGEWIRVGDRRFRVVGTLGSGGESIGLDLDELVLIPVVAAQALFDTSSLFRVMVEADSRLAVPLARADIRRILRQRHDGEDDVTVIAQDAVLSTFDRVVRALTLGVAGIAGISLFVAGILVMNVMLISVAERTAEIGLLKALGSPPRQILSLFLWEAALLSLAGAVVGLAIGQLGVAILSRIYPALPFRTPTWAIGSAIGTALVCGLAFGVLPARRAAQLDPVIALAGR